ncbi:leucine--tRNA ligase [bacterium]|nr:MAG: leucine--tRNA ligase [bacterium]
MEKYDPKKIEKKWQKKWAESGLYKDYSRPKRFYALDMFPYPSGAGLHVGHPKGYIATDVVARFKMLKGFSVLHPMGWDAFGLPAENYAIENKIHPEAAVKINIKTFKKQLGLFGFTHDWDREINTTDPEYYKWTQWIFLKMFEKGLAYESDEPINWCPSCQTGLALEDLENGLCERCGTQVVQKKMRQWVLKMTEYADRLLEDLDNEELDWEKSIIDQQKNWIGRSEGAIVKFSIFNFQFSNNQNYLEIFTTRLDTIFGCTYCVVGPEHPIIEKLKDKIENYKEVEKYIIKAQNKTDLERTDLQKDKTGVELKGVKVINPFNNEELPLFVADYVLGHYGTGAVMAVPAHDERDFEFAKKYKLPVKKVIVPEELLNIPRNLEDIAAGARTELRVESDCFTCDGELVNSGKYSGLTSEKAREEMARWLEKKKIGGKKVNFKMRDWVFSRQRYWGEPIPIIHCEKCGTVAVPEKDLPVELPKVERYEPTGTGEGPLAGIKKWVNVKCPKCGGAGKRETNTMPQWAGSSWYYLRYIDPKNKEELVGKAEEKKWMPVDLYVGGAEHATRHLLYARFWHKFLYDIGAVSTQEPFKKLMHVGLIQGEDGRKMSKRWGNVINPDDVISKFGADSIRLYEMFMGPFTQNIAWSTKGMVGMRRFLEKIYRLKSKIPAAAKALAGKQNPKLNTLLHKTIKKVTEDIENFRFNTAISAIMILVNEMEKEEKISSTSYELLVILLSPFAPHIAEEIWEKLGHNESIFLEKWPEYDPELIKEEQISFVIQINGKVRDQIEVAAGVKEEEAKKLALERDKIVKYIDGKNIRKIIFVPDRLINFVV